MHSVLKCEIVIDPNGDVIVEWDPDNDETASCCFKEEIKFRDRMSALGSPIQVESVSCKMLQNISCPLDNERTK